MQKEQKKSRRGIINQHFHKLHCANPKVLMNCINFFEQHRCGLALRRSLFFADNSEANVIEFKVLGFFLNFKGIIPAA